MAFKIVTKNMNENGTESFPYTLPLNGTKNVKWVVTSGKVFVTTNTKTANPYGKGCALAGEGENSATKLEITASDEKVKVRIDY